MEVALCTAYLLLCISVFHNTPPRMTKIAFIHPDLGIGGAERLVVDAAVGLQFNGHEVTVFTSHCDKSHCFEEVSSGVLKVKVLGDFLPISVMGKLHILCAILRQFYLVICLIWTGQINQFDYFIVDQLSFCVPFLSLFSRKDTKVLFYCHFPDLLLSKQTSFIKSLYRKPFDAIEEWTTGTSDNIVVNSSFTRSIFHQTFTSLSSIEPGIIYPCVDTEAPQEDNSDAEKELLDFMKGRKFVLSINRFERLKNIGLAIKAFADALNSFKENEKPLLIVAGGYDPRVRENVEYLQELERLCEQLKLVHYTFRGKLVLMPGKTQVLFMPSVKTSIKNAALKKAELLLYTPTFEHFGIVPVESMLNKTPVLAINRGGPLESIVNYDGSNLNEATGYNRPNEVKEWSDVLTAHILELDSQSKETMGNNGLDRVHKLFSREKMTEAFEHELKACKLRTRSKGLIYQVCELWKLWVLSLSLLVIAIVYY